MMALITSPMRTKADAVAIGHFVHEAKEAYHHADEVEEDALEAVIEGEGPAVEERAFGGLIPA